MTKRVGEPDTPSKDVSQEEVVFAQNIEEEARRTQFRRDERLRDEWGNTKVWFLRSSMWGGLLIYIAIMATVLLAIGTVAVHAFMPFGWLSESHLQSLTAWCSDASPAIVPALLITNSWILHALARRIRADTPG